MTEGGSAVNNIDKVLTEFLKTFSREFLVWNAIVVILQPFGILLGVSFGFALPQIMLFIFMMMNAVIIIYKFIKFIKSRDQIDRR